MLMVPAIFQGNAHLSRARTWTLPWRPHLGAIVSVVGGLAACAGPPTPQPQVAPTPNPTAAPAEQLDPGVNAPVELPPPLTRDEIRTVVRAKVGEVRACFEAGLSSARALQPDAPDIGGRLVIEFTIDARGRAGALTIVSDELGEPAGQAQVAPCLLAALARWQFPRPRDGAPMTLRYPFVFSSEDSLRDAGLPRVQGTVSPAAVGAVFALHVDALATCVGDEHGALSLAFILDDGGRVRSIAAPASELSEPATACVLATVGRWSFPPAAPQDEARVNHDLRW